MKTTLFVMTHKKIEDKRIPKDRTMMLVGAYNKDIVEYIRDDEYEDNISNKNSSFCELTGLYHIWKHDDSSIVGLEHYRRLFSDGFLNLFRYKIVSKKKIIKYLDKYDIVLPKMHCWPMYDNLYAEFKDEHIIEDMDKLAALINSDFSEYSEAFKMIIHNNKWAYNYNMFVSKKEFITEYFEFLFGVLFKLEPLINLEDGRDNYQKRLFGFLSERLFNVWLYTKKDVKIKEMRLASLGDKPSKDFIRRIYRVIKWRKHKKSKVI